MRILVTGSHGQLGNALREALETGKTEIGVISSVYSDAEVIYNDSDELDITDLPAVLDFFKSNQLDIVFNCAAFTNVDACETQPDVAYAVNAIGPKNLAIAAQEVGSTLVHVSTDYVFSGNNTEPRVETDVCDPQSVYGKTKLAGEQFVAENCSKYFIVRTAWLYGKVGNNFVKTIIRLAEENGSIKVVNDQFGSPTYAGDLAYEMLQLAQTSNYGIYHCTNNGSCSWFDFASKIVDLTGIPCKKTPCSTEEFPRPAKRPKYSILDNAHLRDTIGDQMGNWQKSLECLLPDFTLDRE